MRAWLIGSLLLCCSIPAVGSSLQGMPPIVRHAPDLGVDTQNFAIAESPDGLIFVGNAEGVLEFDGESWRLIRMDNGDIVRSLAIDEDGDVYVGGYDSFGMLARDPAGVRHYRSLVDRFHEPGEPADFADIWQTVITGDGVYFRALREVFFIDHRGEATARWNHAGRFGVLFEFDGEVYLQFRGEGLRRRQGAAWEPVPGTGALKDLVFEALPLAAGGVLLYGRGEGWWRFDGGALERWSMPDSMPPPAHSEHGAALADGTLAFGTADGRLLLVDPEAQSLRIVPVDDAFIAGLLESRFGGLLAVTDGGFHHVRWPAPWSVLAADHGVRGTLYDVARWNDRIYLLGTAGALRSVPTATGGTRFERDPRLDDAAHALLPMDSDRALLGGAHQLYLLAPDGAVRLSEEAIYPRAFWSSAGADDSYLVGTENGLRRLRVDEDSATIGAAVPAEGDVLPLTLLQRPGEIWFGTARDGVWRVSVEADGQLGAATHFDEARGLALGAVAYACLDEGASDATLAATAAGFFRWDGERFEATDLDGLESLRDADEVLCPLTVSDGSRWATSGRRVFHQPAAGAPWREERIQLLRRGDIVDVLAAEGSFLVAASSSLLLRDVAADARPTADAPAMRLRRVDWIGADGARAALPLSRSEPLVLPRGDWGIRFEFAMQRLDGVASVRYRGRLVGYEAEFSDWSRTRAYTYSRLSAGAYEMQLEAIDREGRVSAARPYRLVIEPPWYDEPLVRALALVAGIILLVLLMQLLLRRRTAQLESLVRDRTRALKEANRSLERMARVDSLTGAANRRGLDEHLAAAFADDARLGTVALLAIDVDHFKRFNDRHGHQAGDRLLQRLVALVDGLLAKPEQLLGRYGGEEFMVVLPGHDAASGAELAERLRAAVDAADLGATISIGVAACVTDGSEDSDGLIAAADRALYAAKAAGRNRVEAAAGP